MRTVTLAAGLLLAACAGSAPPLPPPAPTQAAAAASYAAPAPYHVQVGDELAVRLFNTPELNEDVTVRPDGRFSTQLAEAVPAAGRTPEDIAATLRQAYAGELKNPRIVVEVKSYAPARVYVAGEVNLPGELTSTGPPPSLLGAIARAGGVKLSGDVHRVLIVRRAPNGSALVVATRYADALSGRDPMADVPLAPFDVVVVPKTTVAELYVWVNQHIQQFVPVSWGFSYNVTPYVNNKP